MNELVHKRGRWMTTDTSARCVHHVALADACLRCGDTGPLESFSNEKLLAECDRRRLFAPVVVADAPVPLEPEPGHIIRIEHVETPAPAPVEKPKKARK